MKTHKINKDNIINISDLKAIEIQALRAQKNEINAKVLISQNDIRVFAGVFCGTFIPLSIQIRAHNHRANNNCNTTCISISFLINK